MSTVTLRNAILEARAALTGFTALTDLIPERNITFGNSPQKDRKPRIVIEVSNTDYEATYLASRKVQTYTVEYAVYSESVDQCTAVMDEIRNALDAYTSSEFAVRVSDETFQAQADNVLVGVVISTFQDTDGVPGYDATVGVALAQAQQDLADAQQDVVDAQTQAAADVAAAEAATAAAEAALAPLQAQLDALTNPGPYNAAGTLGENATHLYSTERIADGYTGPTLRMFDAMSHTGTPDTVDGYTQVDIGPEDYNDYVSSGSNTAYNDGGKRWRVMKVYDQIGDNDLVFDLQEDRDADGNWNQLGPYLTYSNGSYVVADTDHAHGFVSEAGFDINEFTAVYDFITRPTRAWSLGAVITGTDSDQPYRGWGMANWNSSTPTQVQNQMWFGQGGSTSAQFDSVSGSEEYATSSPFLRQTSGGRQTFTLSRLENRATAFEGTNTFDRTSTKWSGPSNNVHRFGITHANYNPAGNNEDGFYSLAIHVGEFFSDAADVKGVADHLHNSVGYRTQRDREDNR